VRVAEAASIWASGPHDGGHTVHLRTRTADYGHLVIAMRGRHQVLNAATAVIAGEILVAPSSLPARAVAAGLRRAVLPGRFEVLDGTPPVVLDVAHNTASMVALRDALDDYFPGRPVVLVFGMIATHDPVEPASVISGRARMIVVTEPAHYRPIPASALAAEFHMSPAAVEVVPDRGAAVARALAAAEPTDVVCVAGSVYLVGDVRDNLLAARPPAAARTSRRRSGAATRR
jgi:dihydrofolate synthase/folylpolyglutamate synthase